MSDYQSFFVRSLQKHYPTDFEKIIVDITAHYTYIISADLWIKTPSNYKLAIRLDRFEQRHKNRKLIDEYAPTRILCLGRRFLLALQL